ncbi:MAG: hypothetical protein KJ011_01770 [Burkholderiaceae bacterium]|nr:hypothetical protein [Burkholderiaceae bacterium]
MTALRARTHSVGNAGNGWNASDAGTYPRASAGVTAVTHLFPIPTVPNATSVTAVTAVTGVTRWPLIVALLLAPERTSRGLAALLARWPANVRRVECADDVGRRRWGHRLPSRAREAAQ